MPKLAAPKRKRAAVGGARGADPKSRQKRARKSDAAQGPAVGVLQPKLRVSEPNDKYEREADHMADRVMKSPAPSAGTRPPAARGRAEDERKPALQREKTEKDDDKKA